jgi:hypothetical protein
MSASREEENAEYAATACYRFLGGMLHGTVADCPGED